MGVVAGEWRWGRAIMHDPVNEELYQRVIRLQGRLGRIDAVRRTLKLLETRLHEQIDADLSATTRQLVQSSLNPTRQSVPSSNATNRSQSDRATAFIELANLTETPSSD